MVHYHSKISGNHDDDREKRQKHIYCVRQIQYVFVRDFLGTVCLLDSVGVFESKILYPCIDIYSMPRICTYRNRLGNILWHVEHDM